MQADKLFNTAQINAVSGTMLAGKQWRNSAPWYIGKQCFVAWKSWQDCDKEANGAAAPNWCKTAQVDKDIRICLPAAANATLLQQAWGTGVAGFRDASDFIERNCDTPSSWVSDVFM